MLLQKNEKSQAAHASKKSFFPSSEKSSIEILDAKISTKPVVVARYKSISEAVASSKLMTRHLLISGRDTNI